MHTPTTIPRRRRLTARIVAALASVAVAATLLAPAANAGISTSPGSVKKRTLDGNATTERTLYGLSSSPGKKRTLDNNTSMERTLYGFGTSPGKKRTLDGNASNGGRTLLG